MLAASPDYSLYFGFGVFLIGQGSNFYHHILLTRLRSNESREYKIPEGGLFSLVNCPHYLSEIDSAGLALARFRPEMIFISAGFDAHRDDDMAGLNFSEDDYAWVTRELMRVADKHARGRVVSTLEGGYNLRALALSAAAHVRELLRA